MCVYELGSVKVGSVVKLRAHCEVPCGSITARISASRITVN